MISLTTYIFLKKLTTITPKFIFFSKLDKINLVHNQNAQNSTQIKLDNPKKTKSKNQSQTRKTG